MAGKANASRGVGINPRVVSAFSPAIRTMRVRKEQVKDEFSYKEDGN
jgi:hypothetical protein